VSALERILALARMSWVVARSYRLNLVLSAAWTLASTLPLYYVARAIRPIADRAVAGEAGGYFGFVLVGTALLIVVLVVFNALPNAVSSGVTSGTLEAMLATPTSLPVLLAGLVAYPVVWAVLRAALMLAVGALLGAPLRIAHPASAALAGVLAVAAYAGLGLVGAALALTFRAGGPWSAAVGTATGLLGGVYYPTHALPAALESLAALVPLAPAARLVRCAVLAGGSVGSPACGRPHDLAHLALLALLSLGGGAIAFGAAMRTARREGTLGRP